MGTGSKRRDHHDIVAEILRAAREGSIKTHILYRAKLSYSQLQRYLPLLVENGLLRNTSVKRRRRTTTVYETTSKGRAYLDYSEFMQKLCDESGSNVRRHQKG